MTTAATPVASTPSLTALPRGTRVTTGILLIAAAVLAAAGAVWLSAVFSWPDILDAAGAEAIPAFAGAEAAVRTAFYFMLVSSLLLIPAAIYLEQVVGGPSAPAVRAVTAFGVLGGFAQILGWVRWPVTMPHLAETYAAADETTRVSVASSYDVLNRYAGGALGEHLGWLFQGLWAIGLAILLVRVVGVHRWFSYLGLLLSLLWLPMTWGAGLFDIEWLAPVGSTISVGWYLWLLALGIIIMTRRTRSLPTT
jgi:Domain of unknown function (DUF4386)